MKERSLIAFTLLSQMAVGAFWTLCVLYVWASQVLGAEEADAMTAWGFWAIALIMFAAIGASMGHLGTPENAWRALANLRTSWLSREILFAAPFAGMSGFFAILQWLKVEPTAIRIVTAGLTALLGLALVYSMARAYRLRTVPAWDTWVTPVRFFTTALLLGALAVGALIAVNPSAPSQLIRASLFAIAAVALLLIPLDVVVFLLWMKHLRTGPEAASCAASRIRHAHRALFFTSLALAIVATLCAAATLGWATLGMAPRLATAATFGLALAYQVAGRTLFYHARVRTGL